MTKAKRFISGFLAALCIFSMCSFPASASADESNPQTILGVVDEFKMVNETIMPRAPTCATCGAPTSLRTGIVFTQIFGICTRDLTSTHKWAVDGTHYVCYATGYYHYNGTVTVYDSFEYCTSGNHHEYYTMKV